MVGFGIRWAFAFVLLAATYNPTGWNLTRWGMENWETQMPLTLFLGLLLLVGYIIYLRATLRSIGLFGMVLILLIAATFLWVLYDYGWISLEDPTVNTWIGLALMSLVLGIGLNWSHVRRRLSGQSDIDDVDE
ncbi:hypothetical protein EU803_02270 [Loktanella sp. IMCC34160]|uniref:DUF6524 family protein n=1 Tax=Loktanella sp. IMCC34160 TaxID=2510646 RepID=UPI00101BB654|nr:DUF6524 family protein [Loktanella sp. IMCC34160]RYG92954.1 hypothetical protein EU803_02270 [Loktanella sp. IMCC34160]